MRVELNQKGVQSAVHGHGPVVRVGRVAVKVWCLGQDGQCQGRPGRTHISCCWSGRWSHVYGCEFLNRWRYSYEWKAIDRWVRGRWWWVMIGSDEGDVNHLIRHTKEAGKKLWKEQEEPRNNEFTYEMMGKAPRGGMGKWLSTRAESLQGSVLKHLLLLLFSPPSACWQWDSYKAPPDFSVPGRFTNPGQVDVFLVQVFPDIVHPDFTLPRSTSLSLHMFM